MTVADYCPKCDERTALVERGRCPFCDATLEVKARRGGWRHPARGRSKFTDDQLRVLHRLHVEQGASINQLAKRVAERVGYASHHSAAQAISAGWKRLGLKARDRIEQVRKSCTVHGQAPKHRTAEQERAYRRFLMEQRGWRAQQGPGRPQCAGVKANSPGAGRRCGRPAMTDSEFCLQHDPLRALEVQAHLARSRRRQAAEPTLPMAPFAAWLHALADEQGSLCAVADRLGMQRSAAYRFAKGLDSHNHPKGTITVATVERYAAAAGTTADAIYDTERAAA